MGSSKQASKSNFTLNPGNFFSFGFSDYYSKYCTIDSSPLTFALSFAVNPYLSLTFKSAPSSTRNLIESYYQFITACIRGVFPSLSLPFISRPLNNKYSRTPTRFNYAASPKAFRPYLVSIYSVSALKPLSSTILIWLISFSHIARSKRYLNVCGFTAVGFICQAV